MLMRALAFLLLASVSAAAAAQRCDAGPPLLQGHDGRGPVLSRDGTMLLTRPLSGLQKLISTRDLREVQASTVSPYEFAADNPGAIYPGESGVRVLDAEYRLALPSPRDDSKRWEHQQVVLKRHADGRDIFSFPLPWDFRFSGTRHGRIVFFAYSDLPGEANFSIVDLRAGREIMRGRREGNVWYADLSPDGKLALVGSLEGGKGSAVLVDIDSKKFVATYPNVTMAQFSRDGELILLGNGPGAGVVRRDDPSRVMQLPGINAWNVFELPGGLIAGHGNNAITAFERKEWRPIFRVPASNLSPYESRDGWTPASPRWQEGRYVAFRASSADASFFVMDARSGRKVCEFSGDPNRFRLLAITALTDEFLALHWDAGEAGGYRWALYRIEDPGAVQPASVAVLAEARQRSAALGAEQRARAQGFFKQAFELFQAGEFDAAVRRFTQGLEIDPANGVAHFYLAETYARQSKTTLARTHYQRTIDFAPDSKEAALAETRIKP